MNHILNYLYLENLVIINSKYIKIIKFSYNK